MDNLISRAAAIAHAISGRTRELDGEKWIRISEVRESLQTMPSEQPERKNGKWTEWWSGDCALIMTGEEMLWKCSECDSKYIQKSNFCPNCGADNRGEEDE